jgi:5-methyltetrahydropteroyltriglutamate--homocysteine methyltransferase
MTRAKTGHASTTSTARSEQMPPSTPPFRAEHVGSLLRPATLKRARADLAAGRIDADELRAVEDAAVAAAVRLQEDVGLRCATDGELRRDEWHMDFIYELEGISHVASERKATWGSDTGTVVYEPPGMEYTGRIGIDHTIFGDAFAFLREQVTTAVPKLTIPSPSMVHLSRAGGVFVGGVYGDDEAAFWDDVTAAYSAQIRRLGELGVTYLQIDDTSFGVLNDPAYRARIAERGGDAAHLHETYIENFNRAVADRPEGMTLGTHMCRGNFRSSWVAEGGYDFIAEALLTRLDVDAFFMEFDDERSGGFEPLRHVPPGKRVVLGLITTKRPELESKDELKRRIEQASRYVDIDQLCLSPQCGFSSTEEGNDLTEGEQTAKLRLVVETAEEVWGRR